MATSPAPSARGSTALLAPEVLTGLATLELIARAAVDGFLIGLHRAPIFGFSQEFAEYRPYTPGDDPRFIDWNVFARSDRTYIKRFLGETNTHLALLLDASASMAYGAPHLSKFRYAQMLAASLAYLANRQHDAVGLIVFDEVVRDFRPPATRSGHLASVLHAIDRSQPARRTDYQGPFERFREHFARRGMVVVISDFYCEPKRMLESIRPLAQQGQDVMLLQVLDARERRPALRIPTLLEDMETGEQVEVSTDFAQRVYPERLEQHVRALRDAALATGAEHVLLDTSEPLSTALRRFLLFRERRR